MNLYRNNAIMAGVLFIIATVTNMLGNLSIKPILDAPDYLIQISANENLMIIAALLVLISAFASASIAICLYPILKKYHEALALGSVGFRIMEAMLYIVGVVGLLSLLITESGLCNGRSLECFLISKFKHFITDGKNMGRPIGSDRFFHWWSNVLLYILSIKTHSAMAIRLGGSGSCIIGHIRLVSDSWHFNSFIDGFHFI